MDLKSLLKIPEGWDGRAEYLETLFDKGPVRIERIISRGHRTPEGEWYNQDGDEWVAVLQGEGRLAFEDHTIIDLHPGDWMLLKAHRRHRVEHTSRDPECIWLAVHVR